MTASLQTLKLYALVLACSLYAIGGSPTPDTPGAIELIIAALLIAVCVKPISALLQRFPKTESPVIQAGLLLMLYGLLCGGLTGVMYGHSLSAIARDIAGFGFLFLPIFLTFYFKTNPDRWFKALTLCCLIIGTSFAARSLVSDLQTYGVLGNSPAQTELLYTANMPTVLFTCLFGICLLASIVLRSALYRPMDFIHSRFSTAFSIPLCLPLIFLPMGAMILTLQRAPLGAILLYGAALAALTFIRSPYRLWRIALPAFVVAALLWPVFEATYALAAHKTAITGLNMRSEEFKTVWDLSQSSVSTFLFGFGWGAHFESPAVGYVNVSFTHNLFSTMILKTGIIGCLLSALYLGTLARDALKLMVHYPAFILALAAPLLIQVFLYASFKSLDFGLVLSLIPALTYWHLSKMKLGS